MYSPAGFRSSSESKPEFKLYILSNSIRDSVGVGRVAILGDLTGVWKLRWVWVNVGLCADMSSGGSTAESACFVGGVMFVWGDLGEDTTVNSFTLSTFKSSSSSFLSSSLSALLVGISTHNALFSVYVLVFAFSCDHPFCLPYW